MVLAAGFALVFQACAPVAGSFPKSSLRGKETGGGASTDVVTNEKDVVLLKDGKAQTIVVVGSKAADEAQKKLLEPEELNPSQIEKFKSSGVHSQAIQELVSRKLEAKAIIVLDDRDSRVSQIIEEEMKSFHLDWSVDLKKKTLVIEVAEKTPADVKDLILSHMSGMVISITTQR